DYGKIARDHTTGLPAPEVHADGEIWGETLWQLRQAISPTDYLASENIITRAMELAPPDPSFLDMRNAILLADRVTFGGGHVNTIWSVFASRGMGWSASTTSAEDSAPHAAFDTPPTATGPVSGSVHDASGAAIPGATVLVIGHAELQAATDGAGNYTLTVPAGIYTLLASAPGYEPAQIPNVTTGAGGVNAVLARDWAALSGGAQ